MASYDIGQYLATEIVKMGPFELLCDSNPNTGIPTLTWRIREGQDPGYTLFDLADRLRARGWQAARSLELAARFASGYLAVPLDYPEEPVRGSARGSTHAWAQIYLPGTGWIDFDPTSGKAGKIELVTVAVVRDPHDAIPLHGTFIGFPSDPLGMEVEVKITPGMPDMIGAAQRSSPARSSGAKGLDGSP